MAYDSIPEIHKDPLIDLISGVRSAQNCINLTNVIKLLGTEGCKKSRYSSAMTLKPAS